mmetsp:Transcript_5711/g.10247  ORF Transcript_5711/g.10247 Transcript_5711/m.10247 type:complete len:202 (-) Transcript_5711:1692-2297(-)
MLGGHGQSLVTLLGSIDHHLLILFLSGQRSTAGWLFCHSFLLHLLLIRFAQGAFDDAWNAEILWIHYLHRHSNPSLNLFDEVWFVIPNGAATLIDDPICIVPLPEFSIAAKWYCQLCVPRPWLAILALRRALVIPNLLFFSCNNRDGEAHSLSSSTSTDTMDVVLDVIRKGGLDHEWQSLDIDSTSSNISTYQEAHISFLE